MNTHQKAYYYVANLMNSPWLFYHNIIHIHRMLTDANEYFNKNQNINIQCKSIDLSKCGFKIIQIPETLFYAILFHDCRYIPMRKDNEIISADIAYNFLISNGYDKAFSETVKRLIHSTINHQPDKSLVGQDLHLNKLLIDLDFLHLSEDYSKVKNDFENIKREFLFLNEISEKEYHQGRKLFLENLINRISFFHTNYYQNKNNKVIENIEEYLKNNTFLHFTS